jgi:hypothetical protein
MPRTHRFILMPPVHMRQPGHGGDNRGLNQPHAVPLAVDAHGMPVCILLTAGTPADGTPAGTVIAGLSAAHRRADRGYDSAAIGEPATQQGLLCRHSKIARCPGRMAALYRHRHLVEYALLQLKRWRGACHPVCQTCRFVPASRPDSLPRHLGSGPVTTWSRFC